MSGKNIIITYHLHPTIRSCQTQFKLPSKTNYSENSAQNVKKVKMTRVIWGRACVRLIFIFGIFSTRLLLLITRILRTVWLKKCLTMLKKTEGMAEWGLDYNSTSRLLWEMSTKLWENLPKFIWHPTNIWVFSGTKPGPGGFPCQDTPALRFPSNPASSTGRLGCLTDRQSRGGPMGLPHLETQ